MPKLMMAVDDLCVAFYTAATTSAADDDDDDDDACTPLSFPFNIVTNSLLDSISTKNIYSSNGI